MQIIDIKITPPTQTDPMSRVRFIGDGGDEVAVTIANHLDGGATIDQELVAKAKVMLLHAAAAQIREMAASEVETVVEPEFANEPVADFPTLEDEGAPFQDPDEVDVEAGAAPHMDRTNQRPVE